MRLSELCRFEGIRDCNILSDECISSIVYDSRRAVQGSLFFAIRGEKVDGNNFVEDAVRRGAVGVVSDRYLYKNGVLVKDVRSFMGRVAAAFFGYPSCRLNIVGITGTNGKTTTTYLLRSVFSGESGVIGTTGFVVGSENRKLPNTTPESIDLQGMYSELVNLGFKYCFMEVSSHAITFKRLEGTEFRIKVFTNISQDHLDFYGDIENYARAKLSFFGDGDSRVVNGDDAFGKRLIGKNTITYGFSDEWDIYPLSYSVTMDGLDVELRVFGERVTIRSPLIGRYNIYNIMAAVGVSVYLGKGINEIKAGIESLEGVPGRLEFFKKDGRLAVVDYAHTDDAMKNVLLALREIVKGKLIVVFGAGGDRDRGKRPKMGRAAEEMSDIVIVTSDNPRSEDPERIIDDILTGIHDRERVIVEPDREKAIVKALDIASPGDVVAILGKGHEDYQILGDRIIHFDDREVVRTWWGL